MSILEEPLNKLVRDAIDTIAGVPDLAIRARQPDAPRPNGPYATVDLLSRITIGVEQQEYENNTIDADLTGTRAGMVESTYTVNFYRGAAYDACFQSHIGFTRQAIIDTFQSSLVGIGERSIIRTIPEEVSGTLEDRTTFDITLNYIHDDEENIFAILTAEVTINEEF